MRETGIVYNHNGIKKSQNNVSMLNKKANQKRENIVQQQYSRENDKIFINRHICALWLV